MPGLMANQASEDDYGFCDACVGQQRRIEDIREADSVIFRKGIRIHMRMVSIASGGRNYIYIGSDNTRSGGCGISNKRIG